MYIVAIAWLYVALMIAITEPSVTGGVLSFLFYGPLPCGLFLWLVGTPQRRRNSMRTKQESGQPDRTDTQPD